MNRNDLVGFIKYLESVGYFIYRSPDGKMEISENGNLVNDYTIKRLIDFYIKDYGFFDGNFNRTI